jgi:hypothetical protein
VDKLLYPRLPDQATYKHTGTEIAVNLGSAYGHFDNLCLISADKIKKDQKPKDVKGLIENNNLKVLKSNAKN